MTDPAIGFDEATALVREEPSLEGDKPHLTGWLQRLCRVVTRQLGVSGVGLSVLSESGEPLATAASEPGHARVQELQFTLGDGPCLEAFRTGRPVLTPDLAEVSTRWPAYVQAARADGLRAVFAFPLQAGAARLGTMDIYSRTVGSLPPVGVSTALTFSDVALWLLLDAQDDQLRVVARHGDQADGWRPDTTAAVFSEGQDDRLEVYQAQAMVAIQLDASIAVAAARLRAYAFAHDLPVTEVARAIVARRLVLERDAPHRQSDQRAVGVRGTSCVHDVLGNVEQPAVLVGGHRQTTPVSSAPTSTFVAGRGGGLRGEEPATVCAPWGHGEW